MRDTATHLEWKGDPKVFTSREFYERCKKIAEGEAIETLSAYLFLVERAGPNVIGPNGGMSPIYAGLTEEDEARFDDDEEERNRLSRIGAAVLRLDPETLR